MKGSIVRRVGVRGTRYSCVWWTAGRQQWKSGFVKRKDAETYLNAQVRRVHEGTFVPVQPIAMTVLFREWDDALTAHVQTGTIKPSTARSYRSMVKRHLAPAFGTLRSDQVTARVVGTWSRARAEDIADGTLAPKSYNNVVNLLGAILAWARQSAQRYLAHDPLAETVKLPKRDAERPFLEPDQIARLLRAAASLAETAVVMLGAYAGLRRGEMAALRFDDIDWGEGGPGRLWIRRAISGGQVGTPKTKHSIRMVDAPEALLTHLRAYQQAQRAAPTDYLFQTAAGTPIDPDNLSKRVFAPLVVRAHLPGTGLHTLRHTFASLLISHGESIKYVSRQMGHGSIQITADTYGHLFRETSIAAMGRLDARAAAVDAVRLALPEAEPARPTRLM